jgi:hypothetical protein
VTDAFLSLAACVAMAVGGSLGAFTAPPLLTVGDRVTYVEATGDSSCGRVTGISEGNAWILPERSQHRYVVRRLDEVRWGCRDAS